MPGPLTGVRVIELAGIGPAPHAGQLLADLGADVIAVHRPNGGGKLIEARGKRPVGMDLKDPDTVADLMDLIASAHILIEGFRPGVTERLGIGPKEAHRVNPSLIYGRMTGWGQTGPWAHMAGHDINYIGLTGVLLAMGPNDAPPSPPLNLVSDYGGGSMFLIMGVLAALYRAAQTGQGDVVDAAIIDGTVSMAGLVLSMKSTGQWSDQRSANMLDGGMPYYRCYVCKCGGCMAVGAIEPQFFAELLQRLQIDADTFGAQQDTTRHAEQHQLLEALFASKTRDTWAEIFDGSDACATPVLSFEEAAKHKQMQSRAVLVPSGGFLHPNLAPRLETLSDWPLPKIADPAQAPLHISWKDF